MGIDISEMPDPFESIYSFVAANGENVHIASSRLRAWALSERDAGRLEPVVMPVMSELAAQFFFENSVSESRLRKLLAGEIPRDMRDWEPVIVVKTGESNAAGPLFLFVDGHHRYCIADYIKSESILAFILEPTQWEPFRIEGHPDVSADELRATPTWQEHH